MQIVIDLEQESFEDIQNNIYSTVILLDYVTTLVRRGYTSGIEPNWQIEDESNPDTMYWLNLMKNQMQSGCHLSESDVQRCIEAVNEIEAIRDKMLKQFKKVEE